MALPSTLYRFSLQISDVDRGVYESVEVRLARHPSETAAHAMTRLLCYALEYDEALAFGRGIGEPDDPALSITDLQGRVKLWIDVGAPSAERLHRASKHAEVVRVWTHRDPRQLRSALASGRDIHRADRIRLVGVPAEFVERLGERLERTQTWIILRNENRVSVYITSTTTPGDEEAIEAELFSGGLVEAEGAAG